MVRLVTTLSQTLPLERMLFSVVMPAYNEEAVVEATLTSLAQTLDQQQFDYEIIVVNDASKDATLDVLNRLATSMPRLRVLTNEGPNGYGHAIQKGLLAYRGDAAVIVTADGSDAPDDVVSYFRSIEDGFDCAFGSRFVQGARVIGYPRVKLFINRLANGLLGLILKNPYNDYTNGFKAYRRAVIDSMQPIISGQFNITIEMTVKALQGPWRYSVCATDWSQREAGASSFNVLKMLKPYGATLLYCLTLKYLRNVRR